MIFWDFHGRMDHVDEIKYAPRLPSAPAKTDISVTYALIIV